ncbi:NYN domain-containing protein [soil metagenome]
MNTTTTSAATKLALLIDGDNVSATYMPLIMREVSKHGVVAIRRIYGQFKSGKMKSWMKHLEEFDLTPVNVSPLTSGKNATDMKLVIEAMDMLHGRQLDGICIASSDGDFTPLAARVRGNALAVFGFGAKKAPAAYKAEFDRFYECDTILAGEKKEATAKAAPARKPASAAPRTRTRAAPPPPPPPIAPSKPAASAADPVRAATKLSKTEILARAGEAIDSAMGEDGRAHMRTVGNKLARAVPGFAARDYGYKSITDLIGDLPGIELTKQGSETFVRWKPL